MLKVSRADLLTPANAITATGLALTVAGSFRLDTMFGFSLALGGRLLDIADGQVARRTHTSHFGALFDAGADKASVLALIISAFYFNLAPVMFLIFVLLYNAGILYMSLDGEKYGVKVAPTRLGKYTMFAHIAALLSFALAKVTPHGSSVWYAFASVLALIGVVSGAASFLKYVEIYRDGLRKGLKSKPQK
jgi:phosphatidylglycerophosphate synthase